MTLLEHLRAVPDPRRTQGRRYPLDLMLAATIMAMMTGHSGYRAIARFMKHNAQALRQSLAWPRKTMPSNVTVRAVLQSLDFDALAAVFCAWAAERLPEDEILALDGKAIGSTYSGHGSAAQNFAALVSAYGVRSGLVVSASAYQNGASGESEAARELIAALASALDLTGVTVTLDALHCSKKHSAH